MEYGPLDPVECLELHPTVLVLLNYKDGERLFVDFAKFFTLNVKVLKKMEIRVLYNRNDKWMQCRLLQVENRASQMDELNLKMIFGGTPLTLCISMICQWLIPLTGPCVNAPKVLDKPFQRLLCYPFWSKPGLRR